MHQNLWDADKTVLNYTTIRFSAYAEKEGFKLINFYFKSKINSYQTERVKKQKSMKLKTKGNRGKKSVKQQAISLKNINKVDIPLARWTKKLQKCQLLIKE